MNPSIIKYRIRFLDIKPEKSFLGDSLMSAMSDKKMKKGGNERLSLRQRQSKVYNSLEEDNDTVIHVNPSSNNNSMNGNGYAQHEPAIETFHVFKGDVENPMV